MRGGKTVLNAWGLELTTTHVGLVVIALGVVLHARAMKGNTKLVAAVLTAGAAIMVGVFVLPSFLSPDGGPPDPREHSIRLLLEVPAGIPVNTLRVVVDEKVITPDRYGVVRLPKEYRGKTVRIENRDGAVLARPTVPIDSNSMSMTVKIRDVRPR